MAEKNGEAMKALIEKIEGEGLVVDVKMLNDAKNSLSKMK